MTKEIVEESIDGRNVFYVLYYFFYENQVFIGFNFLKVFFIS